MTQLLQNAVYGTALILAVAALRGALKGKLLPEARLALWAVCLFRLFTPAAPASALSFWGLFQQGAREVSASAVPVPGPIAAPNVAAVPAAPVTPAAPAEAGVPWGAILAVVWIAVGFILAARYALAYARTRRAVGRAIPLGREDARYAALPKCARLREGSMDGAPLTFGVARPTVVLTPGLDGAELACVLAHEGVHALRRDNLWHYAAAAALTVFWWDPAVWLMARLIRRDVELSCDRAAVRRLGADRRAEYAAALVTLSTQAEGGAFCHGFGPKRTEERIIAIMKYKKATITGIALTLALVLAVTVGFASNPEANITDISSVTVTTEYRTPGVTQDYVLSESDSSELIRLINSYPKTVYPEGDTRANDLLDVWMRLDCVDGGYYVLHYSYCSGFSWNPLHPGEDDYYSLLTHFDAAGNAGTTWKLDYDFDRPFIDWWTDTAKRIFSVPDEEGATSPVYDGMGSSGLFVESGETEGDFVSFDSTDDPDVILRDYTAMLEQRVAEGRLTQSEADELLANMKTLIERAKNGEIKGLMFNRQANGEVSYVEELDLPDAGGQDGMYICIREDCGNNSVHEHDGVMYKEWRGKVSLPAPSDCTREDCAYQPSVHFHEADGSVTYVYNDVYNGLPAYVDETEADDHGNETVYCTLEECPIQEVHYHDEDGRIFVYNGTAFVCAEIGDYDDQGESLVNAETRNYHEGGPVACPPEAHEDFDSGSWEVMKKFYMTPDEYAAKVEEHRAELQAAVDKGLITQEHMDLSMADAVGKIQRVRSGEYAAFYVVYEEGERQDGRPHLYFRL